MALVVSSLLGAFITWRFAIETTGVNLERAEQTPRQPVGGDANSRGLREVRLAACSKSLLAALLRKTQTLKGSQIRFGLDCFSRLASTFFKQAARMDFF
ncbi:hypothetical protein [Fundidesulfovibrio butyratiphilus]